MISYFPFGHIIVDVESVETIHPYFAAWNIADSNSTESATELTPISELYY